MPFNFGDEILNENDMVTATCAVNKGDLPLEISWFQTDDLGQDKKLTTNEGIVITRTNQRISMLSIDQVKPYHVGNFSCRVSNRAGVVQVSSFLSINGYFKFYIIL
jgi:Down syndrome cell adhesion protein 1